MSRCQRCFIETKVTIMSMFNTQVICMDCKDKEEQHPDYKKANDADIAQIRQGNYNYAGTGKPADL